MKVIGFLIDNWWLLLFGWGIWRAITKKSTVMQAQLKQAAAARAQVVAQRAQKSDDDFDGENERIYQFESPVAAEEQADEKARIAAFNFVPAEILPSPSVETVAAQARRANLENLHQVYGTPPVAESVFTATTGVTIDSETLRRAIILSEIILPPRSRRPLR